MMDQRAAPPELLNDLGCFCPYVCTEDCVCVHNEQPCTVAYSCSARIDVEEYCKIIFTYILAAV